MDDDEDLWDFDDKGYGDVQASVIAKALEGNSFVTKLDLMSMLLKNNRNTRPINHHNRVNASVRLANSPSPRNRQRYWRGGIASHRQNDGEQLHHCPRGSQMCVSFGWR